MTFLLPVLTILVASQNFLLPSYLPIVTVQQRYGLVGDAQQLAGSEANNRQEKVTVINFKSGNVQSVAAPAAAHSPVFVPCHDCDVARKGIISPTPSSVPTVIPTQTPQPTMMPQPTFIPVITVEPEPSMPYPIDPPPCDWKKYPPRPDVQQDMVQIVDMPCIYLDQQ